MPESTRARYDSPLVVDEPCLILPDLEAPFHNADWVQKCCDLAGAWGVRTLVLAGDALHWESINGFGEKWKEAPVRSSDNSELLDFMRGLDQNMKEQGIRILEKYGVIKTDDSVPGEIAEVRHVMRFFNVNFDQINLVLGNHEDRLLRKLEAALSPDDLLNLLAVGPKWRSAPYYYCLVNTKGGDVFRVTHPRSAANSAAVQIAVRKKQHVVMGHSHKWSITKDPTGQLFAIHAGHCVDEARLAYVEQRDRGGYDAHCLGAVIIRDGYPWVLGTDSPFEMLKRLK